jgi:hypothetical protein
VSCFSESGSSFSYSPTLGTSPGWTLVGAIALSVAIIVGGYLAGKWRGWRKMPLTYHEYPQRPDGITDERHGYHLGSLDDVRTWRRLYAERIVGAPPRRQTTSITATIEGGRWLAGCPNCGGSWMLVTPEIDTVVCLSDCNGEYPLVFPEDREEIERLVPRAAPERAVLERRDPRPSSARSWPRSRAYELAVRLPAADQSEGRPAPVQVKTGRRSPALTTLSCFSAIFHAAGVCRAVRATLSPRPGRRPGTRPVPARFPRSVRGPRVG